MSEGQSRHEQGAPSSQGGQFKAEGKSTDTGVDLGEESRWAQIKEYNARGSFLHPVRPMSAEQVVDFYENVKIPDELIDRVVAHYDDAYNNAIITAANDIFDNELSTAYDAEGEKLSKWERTQRKSRYWEDRHRLRDESREIAKKRYRENKDNPPPTISQYDRQVAIRCYSMVQAAAHLREDQRDKIHYETFYPLGNDDLPVAEIFNRFKLYRFKQDFLYDASHIEGLRAEQQTVETLRTMAEMSKAQAEALRELNERLSAMEQQR